jgi:hypothetical protein
VLPVAQSVRRFRLDAFDGGSFRIEIPLE